MFRFVIAYISLLALTAVLVLALRAFDAGTLVSLAVFALFGVSIGFAIASFVDRIPEIRRPGQTRHRPVPPST